MSARVIRAAAAAAALLVPLLPATAPAAGGEVGWQQRFGERHADEQAIALAVAPDGSRVFVVGNTSAGTIDEQLAAYDGATGALIWSRRLGRHDEDDYPVDVATSPDGTRIYLTGYRRSARRGFWHYSTFALAAESGAELWEARYRRVRNLWDTACCLAVSPDGARVFVTGESETAQGSVIATVAYDGSTGELQWVTRWEGPGTLVRPNAIVVSPEGAALFIAATELSEAPGYQLQSDYRILSLSASTGVERWAARYRELPFQRDAPRDIVVAPDGSTVFVTGTSIGEGTRTDYATLTLSAASGARAWIARFDGPGASHEQARSIEISPDGARVLVTGSSGPSRWSFDLLTIAYDASTGSELWRRRFGGPSGASDRARDLAISPDGGTVFVTGFQDGPTAAEMEYEVVAYSMEGLLLWNDLYDGGLGTWDRSCCIEAAPDGSGVFVTGTGGGGYPGYLDLFTLRIDAG